MARGTASTAQATERGTKAAAQAAQTHRHAGPWGASFDGTEPDGKTPVKGLTFERRWTRPGIHPYDEITWEYRTAGIANETGKSVFEQKDVEVPDFWSQLATNVVVSKYFRGHLGTPERETSVKQLIDRVVNTIAAWAETQHYFATDEDLAGLPGGADPPDRPPEDGVQLAGLVQRRHRGAAAVLGLLHQLGPGHDVLDHGPRQDRGHALQVRLGRRQQPLPHPQLAREDGRRRHRLGPRQLHEGLRRLRRRREVGRQDPARGQDGHPRRRPSGRPRVHRFEGARGAEGLGAHRGRVRPQLHRRGLRQRLLPERQPQRPRDRRVHAGRRRRQGLDDPRGRGAARADGHVQGPRHLPQDGRGGPHLRRPGHPVRHHHQRLAHLGEHGSHLREQPVLRVHVPQRHRVQPGQPQPHEVRPRRTASSTPRPIATRPS